jgi:hypothetical protein
VNLPGAGYLRSPAIRGETIVFVCEDSLWMVAAGGGQAHRLDGGTAEAGEPRLSPDGRHVAFAGRDAGSPDVYLIPLAGGTVHRLTHQGGWLTVLGFDPPTGHVLYSTDAVDRPSGRSLRTREQIRPNSPHISFYFSPEIVVAGSRSASASRRAAAPGSRSRAASRCRADHLPDAQASPQATPPGPAACTAPRV